jgi:hypothetical protein
LPHRFPAKAVLPAAVGQECGHALHLLSTAGARLPPGPDRDRDLIGLLARPATAKPGRGVFRLLVIRAADSAAGVRHQLFSAFEADAIAHQTRVLAALGALLTVSRSPLLGAGATDQLIAIGCDALGHAPVGTTPQRSA